MQFFKMESSFFDDTKITRILEDKKNGYRLIVFWFFLLGSIAEHIKNDASIVSVPLSQLERSRIFISKSKMIQMLNKLSTIFDFKCESVGNQIHINYPKFLKIHERYLTKTLRESSEKPPTPGQFSEDSRSSDVNTILNPKSQILNIKVCDIITQPSVAETTRHTKKPASRNWLLRIWNAYRGTLPEAKSLGIFEEDKTNRLWSEVPDEKYWEDIIKKIVKDPYCNGQNKEKWIASFSYLLKEGTHNKIANGLYDRIEPRSSNEFSKDEMIKLQKEARERREKELFS